jgi:hypothetical protein
MSRGSAEISKGLPILVTLNVIRQVMNRRPNRNVNALSKAPLLPSENSADFESLYAALEEEIKPRGIIERLYLEDFANIVWEILRLRRCKSAIINRAFRSALRDLILKALPQPERQNEWLNLMPFNSAPSPEQLEREDEAEELAEGWFVDPKVKRQVMAMLQALGYGLDDVEASAFQKVSDEIVLLDRMLTLLEARRNKALACIAEYRKSFAQQLSQSSEKIIQGNTVLRLEDANKKSKTA